MKWNREMGWHYNCEETIEMRRESMKSLLMVLVKHKTEESSTNATTLIIKDAG